MRRVARGSCRKHMPAQPTEQESGAYALANRKRGLTRCGLSQKSGKSGSRKDEAGRAGIRSLLEVKQTGSDQQGGLKAAIVTFPAGGFPPTLSAARTLPSRPDARRCASVPLA